MPLLHRLACFRDDIVFVILLYQMYICAFSLPNALVDSMLTLS